MTLSEIVITAAICAMVLFVMTLGMDGIRTELKRRQTLDLLDTLDRALVAYHGATGSWPVDLAQANEPPASADQSLSSAMYEASCRRVIAILAGVPASRTVLQTIPPVLRVQTTGSQPTTSPDADWGNLQDSWGHPLNCLTALSPLAVHRKAVAANENRPIFVSAGPDGHFGFIDAAAASDNLRSDEPSR